MAMVAATCSRSPNRPMPRAASDTTANHSAICSTVAQLLATISGTKRSPTRSRWQSSASSSVDAAMRAA